MCDTTPTHHEEKRSNLRFLSLNIEGLRAPPQGVGVVDDEEAVTCVSWTILWKLVEESRVEVAVLSEIFASADNILRGLEDGFRLREWNCCIAPGLPSLNGGRSRCGVLIAWKASCLTAVGSPEILLPGRILKQKLQHVGGICLSVVGCYGPNRGSPEEIFDFWFTLKSSVDGPCVLTGDLNAHLVHPHTESDWQLEQILDEEFGLLVDVGQLFSHGTMDTFASGEYSSRIDYVLSSRTFSDSWTDFRVLECGKKHRALISQLEMNNQIVGAERPVGLRGVQKILPVSRGGKEKMHELFQDIVSTSFVSSGHTWNILECQSVLRACASQVLDNSVRLHCRTVEGARLNWTSWAGRRKMLESFIGLEDEDLQFNLKKFVQSNWFAVKRKISHKHQCVSEERFKSTFQILLDLCSEQEKYWWRVFDGRNRKKKSSELELPGKLESAVRNHGVAVAFRCFHRGRRGGWEPISQLHPDEDTSLPVVSDPKQVWTAADA